MNNLPVVGNNAGAVDFGGPQAAPAQFTVGEIGFGPCWSSEDSMAASIIRLEQENQELRAENAMLREEQLILKGDGLRIAIDAKSWARLSQERDALAEALRESQATIESLRDTLCEYKCRDKAAADGGWANI
jgi:predicted RNase H-like nuclease (RuvC/YqgF family)